MQTRGLHRKDPPIEIVHFADPWCWWSWGLEPVLQRVREVYGDNVQVTYKMGGEFESLKGWMQEYGVDERGTVDWILESVALTHMPVQPDYYFRCRVESSFPACKAFIAAKLQSEGKAAKYFRRMMEAFGLECLPATDATLVKLGGEVGLDKQGKIVGKDDFRAQAAQAFANLRAALAAVGAKPENLVKLNYYVVGLNHEKLLALRELRNSFVNKENPPASTLIGVAALFSEEAQIEIEAVAVIP